MKSVINKTFLTPILFDDGTHFMKQYFIFAIILLAPSLVYSETEKWYTYWSIGYANKSHPSSIQKVIDEAKQQLDPWSFSFSGDTWGFYWPIEGKNIIQGFVVNTSSEFVGFTKSTNNFVIETDVVFSVDYTYSYSRIYFLKPSIGT